MKTLSFVVLLVANPAVAAADIVLKRTCHTLTREGRGVLTQVYIPGERQGSTIRLRDGNKQDVLLTAVVANQIDGSHSHVAAMCDERVFFAYLTRPPWAKVYTAVAD